MFGTKVVGWNEEINYLDWLTRFVCKVRRKQIIVSRQIGCFGSNDWDRPSLTRIVFTPRLFGAGFRKTKELRIHVDRSGDYHDEVKFERDRRHYTKEEAEKAVTVFGTDQA